MGIDINFGDLRSQNGGSDSSESLSPRWAPEITPPAVMAVDTHSIVAIATRPTPMVPPVVHELPMDIAITPQMTAAAR